ncbi:MAG TPA: sulfur carrier protein ThiS [Pyrinomonadaceae bacterium]|nr:sulfur carrier protein ThiS [Pyrinomonadaceae bacterium]
MRVRVNGEEREVPEGTTLGGLVGLLGLVPERLAVERNRQVVRRAEWAGTPLEEGDAIEIVHFVGGGSSGARTSRP